MMLAIRLPSDIEERLERLAKATGRTKTYYVRARGDPRAPGRFRGPVPGRTAPHRPPGRALADLHARGGGARAWPGGLNSMPARSETCAGSTPRSRGASCATFASASPWWTIRAASGRRCGAPPALERPRCGGTGSGAGASWRASRTTSCACWSCASRIAVRSIGEPSLLRHVSPLGWDHILAGRPELGTILDFIHPGETLVVTRIDRLVHSMRDLQIIVVTLKDKGAHLAATEQPVDTSTAAGKAFFDMLGVFAEFETTLRCERQAEGIAAAKQRGGYRGRPTRIDMEAIKHRLAMGLSLTDIARELGISRGTVYKARAGIAFFKMSIYTRSGRLGHPRLGGEHDSAGSAPVGSNGSSPRGRGTRARSPSLRVNDRVIPAWAGNTVNFTRLSSSDSNGSSPRGRGTHEPSATPVRIRNGGSSPRGRGTPGISIKWNVRSSIGSSPRGRGTRLRGRRRHGAHHGRVIPAWAGNTSSRRAHERVSYSSGHPRVGGEHSSRCRGNVSSRAGHPRVGGEHASKSCRPSHSGHAGHPRVGGEHNSGGSTSCMPYCRVIPAWAGNTVRRAEFSRGGVGSSPRGRGTRVTPGASGPWPRVGGSSPRGRGTQSDRGKRPRLEGGTGHPRVGGEHSFVAAFHHL